MQDELIRNLEKLAEVQEALARLRKEDFETKYGDKWVPAYHAARWFGIGLNTLYYWIERGYVRARKAQMPGRHRREVRLADVAYVAAIHQVWKQAGLSPSTLLDENGRPAFLRYPMLSAYRKTSSPSP